MKQSQNHFEELEEKLKKKEKQGMKISGKGVFLIKKVLRKKKTLDKKN